jgi:RNA polymerase sigma-70 factor (sigma-E family)
MAATGTDRDFAAYVRARQGALLRSALLLTGDHHAAQDLLQEALTKLASRWARVSEGSPDAYVRRILYRDAVSRWRKTHREVLRPDPLDGDRMVGSVPARDHAADWVTAAEVRSALQMLTAKQRAVLVLRYYEDLSEVQIAETLGVSTGTVKSQAHVALRRLRQLLPEAAEALDGPEEDTR